MIALFGFGRGSDCRGAVHGVMEYGLVGIVFFHGTEIVGTLEQVLTLTRGVFCADRLAVDTLS